MKKILINCENREIRVAILEDEQLTELYIESLDNKTILNNIYKGRIEGVIPGLKAAFVNIGLERNAFLHFDDIRPDILTEHYNRLHGITPPPPGDQSDQASAPQSSESVESTEAVEMTDVDSEYEPSPEELETVAELSDEESLEIPSSTLEGEHPASDDGQESDEDAEHRRKRRRGRRGGKRRHKDDDGEGTPATEEDEVESSNEMVAGPVSEPQYTPRYENGESSPRIRPNNYEQQSHTDRRRDKKKRSKGRDRDNRGNQQQQRSDPNRQWVPDPNRSAPGTITGTRAGSNPFDVFSPYAQQPLTRRDRKQRRVKGAWSPPVSPGQEALPRVNDRRDSQEDFFGPVRPQRQRPLDEDENDDQTRFFGKLRPQQAPQYTDEYAEDPDGPAPGNEKYPQPRKSQNNRSGAQRHNRRKKNPRTMKRRGPQNYAARRKATDEELNQSPTEQDVTEKKSPAARKKATRKAAAEDKPTTGPVWIEFPEPGAEDKPKRKTATVKKASAPKATDEKKPKPKASKVKSTTPKEEAAKTKGRTQKDKKEKEATPAPIKAEEPVKKKRATSAKSPKVVEEKPLTEKVPAGAKAGAVSEERAEKKPRATRTTKKSAVGESKVSTPVAEEKPIPSEKPAEPQTTPKPEEAEKSAVRKPRRSSAAAKTEATTLPSEKVSAPQPEPEPKAEAVQAETDTSAQTADQPSEKSSESPPEERRKRARGGRGRGGRGGKKSAQPSGDSAPETEPSSAPPSPPESATTTQQIHTEGQQTESSSDQSQSAPPAQIESWSPAGLLTAPTTDGDAATDQQRPAGEPRINRRERWKQERERRRQEREARRMASDRGSEGKAEHSPDRSHDRGQDRPQGRPQDRPYDRNQHRTGHDRSHHRSSRFEARRNLPPVTAAMRKGDEIMVQVIKEEIGLKGARISSHISMPGRYLVFLPFSGDSSGGVSRKVEDVAERKRLKSILREIHGEMDTESAGFIVRTAGVDRTEEEIRSDVQFLTGEWKEVLQRNETAKAAECVYDDSNILKRLARDVFDDSISEIIIDSDTEAEKLRNVLSTLIPSLVDKVQVYKDSENIFSRYQVEKQIQKAARRKVWLKSGGYLIIDEAEALTAIDVNTGKFIGKDDQEKMILKTNMEAARAIARELRLRDIGGLIVIDFIDMRDYRNKEQLLNEFRSFLKKDRSKTSVSSISEFGLVEMTRKRVRRSLRKTIFMDCPYCQGSGAVLNEQQIWLHIKNDIVQIVEENNPPPSLNIICNPRIRAYLDQNCREDIEAFKKRYEIDIRISMSDVFHVENYAIERMARNGERAPMTLINSDEG